MTLFPLDQAENDRLLLAEEQRRQDLIDFAVRRFAPHLEGKPDIKVLHLYSTNASLRKEIRSLCGGKTIAVEHVVTQMRVPKIIVHEIVHDGHLLDIPSSADFVATKSALKGRWNGWLRGWLHCQLYCPRPVIIYVPLWKKPVC